MKNIYLIVLLLVFSVSIFGQDKLVEKDQSNLEKFSATSGSLIEKSFVDIATIKRAEIQVLTLTDLMSNIKISGVRFQYYPPGRYSNATLAFLDKDEVDALIKSIGIVKSKVLSSTPSNYTEVTFTSRSGFSVGCYYSDRKWTSFMRISKYDRDSMIVLDSIDLDALETALNKAITSSR